MGASSGDLPVVLGVASDRRSGQLMPVLIRVPAFEARSLSPASSSIVCSADRYCPPTSKLGFPDSPDALYGSSIGSARAPLNDHPLPVV